MAYFTQTATPDLIHGDVSKIIQSDASDLPFGAEDILFDWTSFDVPDGSCALQSITMYMMGEDGAVQTDADFWLIFARSVNGEAPGTLGEENAAQTACFDLPKFLVGSLKIEASQGGSGQLKGPAFGNIVHWGIAGANGAVGPVIIEGEPGTGTNFGSKIYVAAFTGANIDFSTGVLSTGAISADANATIAVDGVDPRKCFQVGDTVYVHDVDTAAGTVASLGSGSIVLDAATAVAVANNDELVNANPIKLVFGFEY